MIGTITGVDLTPFQTVPPPKPARYAWRVTSEQDGVQVGGAVRVLDGNLQWGKDLVDFSIRTRHKGREFSDWHFDDSCDVHPEPFWYRIDASRDFAMYVSRVKVS